jgi:hypothetical protein
MVKNLPYVRNKVIACCVLIRKPGERRNIMKIVLKRISLAEVERLFFMKTGNSYAVAVGLSSYW